VVAHVEAAGEPRRNGGRHDPSAFTTSAVVCDVVRLVVSNAITAPPGAQVGHLSLVAVARRRCWAVPSAFIT
jgi:hypothetical protein